MWVVDIEPPTPPGQQWVKVINDKQRGEIGLVVVDENIQVLTGPMISHT